MKNCEVIFPKQPEVKTRPTRVSGTVLPVAQRAAGGVICARGTKSPKRLRVHASNELLTGLSWPAVRLNLHWSLIGWLYDSKSTATRLALSIIRNE
jgi:hypothetical protein